MSEFAEIDRKLDVWIDERADEIVAETVRLIRIPSVGAAPIPGAPFGAETRRALESVLGLAEKYGFRTKMLSGYAAHADFGPERAPIIGVLSHVDVVPAGSDWRHDPFGAEIDAGRIYGRGAIDDKGPTIAALYALIAVKQSGAPVAKRLRHIVGANEESGFKCMAYYFGTAREEMPEMGFTPDGRFPVIYAEKGIAKPTLSLPLAGDEAHIRILSITAGQRSNMVPDRAEARLGADLAELKQARADLERQPDVTCELVEGQLVVRSVGVSAHGSTPELGVNAVRLLTEALLGVPGLAHERRALEILNGWASDTTGACLGIAGSEEITGPLTSNLGVVVTEGAVLLGTFSIRHPVSWTEEDLRGKLNIGAASGGFVVADWSDYQAPLHVPQDSKLISTLLSVYRAETGDMDAPKTMGGGTYARVLSQGVAFGPNFPGFPDNAHQADEYWTIADLIRATRIYAKALVRLAA